MNIIRIIDYSVHNYSINTCMFYRLNLNNRSIDTFYLSIEGILKKIFENSIICFKIIGFISP